MQMLALPMPGCCFQGALMSAVGRGLSCWDCKTQDLTSSLHKCLGAELHLQCTPTFIC